MTISTFPTIVPDDNGVRWWASADVHSVCGGKTFSLFTGKMFPSPPHHHMGGQKAVIKTLAQRKGSQKDSEDYLRRSREAKDLAKHFYAEISPSERISFINAYISTIDEFSSVLPMAVLAKRVKRMPIKNESIVFEPYISSNMKRFQQESGTNSASNSHRLLETFSHFSYWKSDEQFVICDFKGIVDDNVYKLTCPSIHSKLKIFGDGDNSESGIQSFFSQHVCNGVCKQWPRFQHTELPSYEESQACAARENVKQPIKFSKEKEVLKENTFPPRIEPSAPILEVVERSIIETEDVYANECVPRICPPHEQPPPYSEMATRDCQCGTDSQSDIDTALRDERQMSIENPPPYTEFVEPVAPLGPSKKHKCCQTRPDGTNKISKMSPQHRVTTQTSCHF